MEIVIGGILGLLVLIAIVVLVKVNRKEDNEPEEQETSTLSPDCCGAHEVCEFDRIKMDESIIEYYDDEELDQYKNIDSGDYSNDEIDEFREVLFTLKKDEIRYWLLSIERRKINLPSILQEEARMLMAEG